MVIGRKCIRNKGQKRDFLAADSGGHLHFSGDEGIMTPVSIN